MVGDGKMKKMLWLLFVGCILVIGFVAQPLADQATNRSLVNSHGDLDQTQQLKNDTIAFECKNINDPSACTASGCEWDYNSRKCREK
jgi:archaellum component FlaG (FlaF/FlaG flagellin family)